MSVDNDELSIDSNVSVFSAIDVSSGKEVQIKIEDQGLVAKGGWATVHRGRILPDGEVIAIKRVKETKQYKHREMEILRSLTRHNNIVHLRYYVADPALDDEDDRLLSLFMDYLPSNLQRVIRDHPTGMPLSLIQTYGSQLFQGLAHLASQSIVHRDLLPRNILIDSSTRNLKLADFGCAKVVTPGTPNHPKVGTFQYRAMELLLGATLYDSQADIWSAGVVILEMISGKYPFTLTSEEKMPESILNVMGPITMEQVQDIGVDPMEFPELLASSAFNARRWSDVQVFPQTPSIELRSLLNNALEYSPRRRSDAATLLNHDFFKNTVSS